MQFGAPPVTGIVYNTTMSRPDAALALALLYGLEGKREARVASVAITENSFGAAAFADAVFRFYQLGPIPNANRTLPIGLAADKPFPPDSPAVQAVLNRKDDKGEPAYKRGLRRISDTAEVTALMRNSLTYIPDGKVVVVLSAPATYLARMLGYPGARDLIAAKVRELVIADGSKQDVLALRKVLADWPTSVTFCPRDVGDSLPYPGSAIDSDFTWTTAHPVVDYYRAAARMPYDSPLQDPAALLYAVRPDKGLFQISEPGTLTVDDNSSVHFTAAAGGKHRRLAIDPAQKESVLAVIRELVSAKPVPSAPRRRFTPEELEKLKLQREEELKKREAEEKKLAPPAPSRPLSPG